MRRSTGLTWSQVLMAANTPMLLKAAMVDGRPDLGLMSSGQVVGLIDDLPSCAELIERIMAEAEQCLTTPRPARSPTGRRLSRNSGGRTADHRAADLTMRPPGTPAAVVEAKGSPIRAGQAGTRAT